MIFSEGTEVSVFKLPTLLGQVELGIRLFQLQLFISANLNTGHLTIREMEQQLQKYHVGVCSSISKIQAWGQDQAAAEGANLTKDFVKGSWLGPSALGIFARIEERYRHSLDRLVCVYRPGFERKLSWEPDAAVRMVLSADGAVLSGALLTDPRHHADPAQNVDAQLVSAEQSAPGEKAQPEAAGSTSEGAALMSKRVRRQLAAPEKAVSVLQ
eukprot:3696747-Rhodomonas_salina.3